ncbi:MAG: short-chain dehydrogenase [Armatimonadetes bacterium CG_4_10_14_3_um_filter_66_18]|nr:SDR family oxidoreductase [Armatimonadota bacterium]PIU92831.1 MAG: short-chain dehydrogenase [Armatimonadetes bacterium CG06_land_8_20_14_3_00_66_21]PIW20278.1 MAG: short-chain dehydrogenase [Armatimonadetes bacterium CG17_big_fil_post_rev_8_21_14_2_50_66_6]PIX37905.1 MAG: short-chain dehydrogenase [Armatimonadetes bacterium CG_4_8_14_3_um_filter_66_20]PIY53371.1 MAG: short-chain dehydrogenase [Armatimonadetes bacterium CG_4_10_14_3_um_filter_66_18]PIZ35736.1 MAG: short-chain dehydrogenase
MMQTVRELFDLSGRVALVTGGAGWLGTAMCEALAESGARVAVASRNVAKCRALAERLPGGGHLALALDVQSEGSIRSVVDEVAETAGRFDILVNNAYNGRAPGIDEATAADFQVSFMGGLTSYFVAAQQARTHMLQVGGGSILNIASMYGMVASYPDAYVGFDINSPPTYHALKGGVIHLTRHLAVYWAKDRIRVNAVSPGPFPPDRVSAAEPDFVERLKTKCPTGRMGTPEEVKGAAVYLASEASSYVTGHNLVIDGGWTAW